MSGILPSNSRRGFLGTLAWGGAALCSSRAFAAELARTPAQMEGPFYPDRLPLDTDNDLIIVNDQLTPAVGQITHLGGKILDLRGEPVKNAVIEIWQVDGRGVYLHSGSAGEKRDANFQGYGRFTTGKSGEYYFRTVKPVLYPGRQAPHIHVKVKRAGQELLTTQLYIKGDPGNERDGIYRSLRTPEARAALTVDFAPLKESRIGELAANFDIVLGVTPEG